MRDQSPSFLENINFWESLPRAPNFEYPKKRTTLCKWPLSFYIFTEAACKLVPSNASEVSSDSTRKDLGRILTPNLQAIRVLQSNNIFNFIKNYYNL